MRTSPPPRPARTFSLLRVGLMVAAGALAGALVMTVASPDPALVALPAEESSPLGRPPQVPESGSYAFERTVDGSPVAYDPCRTIDYVVNPARMPPGGDELLSRALGRISGASGLQFRSLGTSNEVPLPSRPAYDPDLYGERWSPVLVAWTDPEVTPDLTGPVLGRGGSSALSVGDHGVYVSGVVELDGPEIATMLEDPTAALGVELVITHELAHLVGLGHVDDTAELMHPAFNPTTTDLGPGDRTGLARLGSGTCFTGLDSPELLHGAVSDPDPSH